MWFRVANLIHHRSLQIIYMTIYTLFDGLAYNTCGYFASGVVFFRAPRGRGKIQAMSKMSAKPSNKRFIIPLQKNCYLQLASTFW